MNKKTLTILTVIAWAALFVTAAIVGALFSDDIPVALMLLVLVELVLSIIATVYYVKARKAEKRSAVSDDITTNETTSDHKIADDHTDIDVVMMLDTEAKLPIRTKVRGVTFDNRQEVLSRCHDGDDIFIEHRPTSEYPNTVAVLTCDDEQLGVISSELANELLSIYGQDCRFEGSILNVTGGNGYNIGCNIIINEFVE